MEVLFDLNKSVEENAGRYFEKAKKIKKKLKGALEALERSKKKLREWEKEEKEFLKKEQLRKEKKEREEKEKEKKKKKKYQKFHWFFSSEGFLCLGGKDATSNERIIKKQTSKGDLVFHTELAGAPFFVVKGGEKAGEKTLKECAQVTACYSKAWKWGLRSVAVYCVKPEQVSKKARAGEYLTKGSFMIYGKRKYFYPSLEYCLGLKKGEIIGGAPTAVKKKTNNFVVLVPGKEKKSDLAKKIKAKLKGGDLEEIMRFLPSGGGEIKK